MEDGINIVKKVQVGIGWIRNHQLKTALILLFLFLGFAIYTLNLPYFVDNQETVILGQADLWPETRAGMRIAVFDHKSGETVGGADVEVSLKGKNIPSGPEALLFAGKTNKEGTADISFAVPDLKGESATLVIKTSSAFGSDTIEKSIAIERTVKISVVTDKPIYQPSQTIHIRSLVFDASTVNALGGEIAVINVEDPKGNRVFKKEVSTNDYGVVSADFVLAENINLGMYKITVSVRNFKSEKTIEVKKYVLPKFKIEISTDKEYYLPNEELTGTINANYFFGKPVSNAHAVIRGYTSEGTLKEFKTLEGQTNADGIMPFDLAVPDYFAGSAADKNKGSIIIEAEVIDEANQILTAKKELTVAKNNLIVEFYPEGGDIKPRLDNIINVVASYPNGEPAEVNLELTALCGRDNEIIIYNLAEGRKVDLNIRSGNETIIEENTKNDDLNGKPLVLKNLKTDIYGLAQFGMMSGLCNVQFQAKARDAKGVTADVKQKFTVQGKNEYILVRPERSLANVGDDLHLDIFTSGSGKNVYVDVIKNSKTISTRSLEAVDGKASLDLSLTPEMAGTLEMHAYQILSNANITRDAINIFVNDAVKDIDISVQPDKTQYLPGQSAKVDIKVSANGEPRQAVLGLKAVDESVFAIAGEDDASLKRIYFLLEKQVMEEKLNMRGFGVSELMAGDLKKDYENKDSGENIERARQQMAGMILSKAPSKANFSLAVNTGEEKVTAMKKSMYGYFEMLAIISFLGFMITVILAFWESLMELRREKATLKVFAITIILLLTIILIPTGTHYNGGSVEGLVSLVFGNLFNIVGSAFMLFGLIPLLSGPFSLVAWILWALLILVGFVYFLIIVFKKQFPSISKLFALSCFFVCFAAFMIFFGISLSRSPVSFIPDNVLLILVILLPQFMFFAWTAEIILLAIREKFKATASALIFIFTAPIVVYLFAGIVFNSSFFAYRQDSFSDNSAPYIDRGPWENSGGRWSVNSVQNTFGLPNKSLSPFSLGEGYFGSKSPERTINLDQGKVAESGNGEEIRLREFFPETLYYDPSIITDEAGRATTEIRLADNITSWRLAAFASTKTGEFGTSDTPIKVFQDFFVDMNLPVSLTVDDEISVPVSVYNYISDNQEIKLFLENEDWFEMQDKDIKTVSVAKNGINAVYFKIKIKKPGWHSLTIKVESGGFSDAVKKQIEILPNGHKAEGVINNTLRGQASENIHIPTEAIGATPRIYVKIYPRFISEVIEGMDSILALPHGCFEQTSSVTYPNVLALAYMQRTGQATQAVKIKAEDYIGIGYQKLVSFEVPGGGFSLFGAVPANEMLTAYGLMEFYDMSKVYEVDPVLITRTAKWLASRQNEGGSWSSVPAFDRENDRFTWITKDSAYIMWALVKVGYKGPEIEKGLSYLKSSIPKISDPYTLAITANVFLDAGDGASADEAIKRLSAKKQEENGLVYWPAGTSTYMGSQGNSANVEATAYAAMALKKSGKEPEMASKAISWLIGKKGSNNMWGSTKTTVAVLETLLNAMDNNVSEGKIKVRINNGNWVETEITKDNFDVMKTIDLSSGLSGQDNKIDLEYSGNSPIYYQIAYDYYLPWNKFVQTYKDGSSLKIKVMYDSMQVKMNGITRAMVSVVNNSDTDVNLPVAEIGIPAGFEVNMDDLDMLLRQSEDDDKKGYGKIQKYEISGRNLIIYFDKINRDQGLSFRYRLTAKYPINAQVPPTTIYEYYNPEKMNIVEPVNIKIN